MLILLTGCLIASVITSLAAFTYAGYYCGIATEQEKRIAKLDESEQTLFDYYYDSNEERNAERKLWTNKALIRGGTERIFPDSVIFTETMKSASDPLENANQTEIIVEPPFAAARKEWKAEEEIKRNASRTYTPPVKRQEAKIDAELAAIKDNS